MLDTTGLELTSVAPSARAVKKYRYNLLVGAIPGASSVHAVLAIWAAVALLSH